MQANTTRQVRTLSLRIPEPLYLSTQQLAAHSKVSINAIVNQALARAIADAQEAEMFEAATLLGMDPESSDVDFAFGAQLEVVLSHD